MRFSSDYQSDHLPNILKVSSRDKTRPVLTCVYLDVDRAELQATDSYCLASVPVTIDEGDVSGLIPPEAIAAFAKARKAWKGSAEYGPALDCSSGESVALETAEGSSSWRRPDGQWPDFPRLIPAEVSGFQVKFSASKLANVADALGSDAVTLSFALASGVTEGEGAGYFPSPLRPILVHNGGHGETGLLMPIRMA
jgi:hypothetical protein